MLSRRSLLHGIGVGLAGTACGSADEEDDVDPTTGQRRRDDDPFDDDRRTPVDEGPEPILSPRERLAGIDHIVVVMMENRSFDHFLGSLKNDRAYASAAQVDGLTGNESNLDPAGQPVQVFRMTNFEPADPPHDWDPCHAQWNGGKNDGFVIAHAGPSEKEVMGFHDRNQLPVYYWLADNFAICDRWFASALGPTWVNRFYLHATTAQGKIDNTPFGADFPDTVWDLCKERGLTFKNYTASPAAWYMGGFAFKAPSLNPTAPIDQFFDALRNDALPAFSIIDPDFFASDDHPSHNIQRGQAFIASVYQALAQSRSWSKCLLVITYDEHGGFYDHVPPPPAADDHPDFRQYGFRVPAIVVGPTVRKGYVCKTVLDHSSVAATLRTRWDVRNLTTRMQNAADISDCIDPRKVAKPALPPAGGPPVAMTMRELLHAGVGEPSQPLLEQMAREGTVPTLDGRSHQERIAAWAAHATRLGALRIVPE